MSHVNQQNAQDAHGLSQALDLLRESQAMNQRLLADQSRLARSLRYQYAGILAVVFALLVSVAMATGAPPDSAMAGAGGMADREALLAMLGDQERQRMEEFESQVQWLSAYMKSSPDFDPGAAVALFLSQVAGNMDAVPKMHSEMQAMNARMAAVPAMVVEMQAINAKLAVMTGAMDSTMGRAGRMFPWMPFSP